MRDLGIASKVRTKRYTSYKGEIGKIAPNLLDRNFNAQAPRRKLVTDVSEFAVSGEKIYLSPVLDLYNREIIEYTISTHPNLKMVMEMMNKVVRKLPLKQEIILHSDQGKLYQSNAFQRILMKKGIKQSMSRKATPLDNAVMENFFGIVKSELLYLDKFESMEQFIRELKKYIRYYNYERIKTKLEGKSPVMYRKQKKIMKV